LATKKPIRQGWANQAGEGGRTLDKTQEFQWEYDDFGNGWRESVTTSLVADAAR
jgi:hypothetical protein